MRDLFFKDLGWKLFSLLLAAGIWLTVHRILLESGTAAAAGDGSPLTYGNLPVPIVAAAADVHFFRVAPATVSVTVSGPADIMASCRPTRSARPWISPDSQPDGDLHRPRGSFRAVRHDARQRRTDQSRPSFRRRKRAKIHP